MTSSPYRSAIRSPTDTSPSIGSTRSSLARARPSGDEDAARGQVVEVERRAHQGARERTQLAARPDPGRRVGRVHNVQAQPAGQLHALGATVEHGLRADVDDDSSDLEASELAADPIGTLDHHDLVARIGQVAGGGQPGDTGADDKDLHGLQPRRSRFDHDRNPRWGRPVAPL